MRSFRLNIISCWIYQRKEEVVGMSLLSSRCRFVWGSLNGLVSKCIFEDLRSIHIEQEYENNNQSKKHKRRRKFSQHQRNISLSSVWMDSYCYFLAKLFPQLCSCNWNGNCDLVNDKKVIIWHFCDLFSNYEWQKGHNFPILWPFQELWTTERSQFAPFITTGSDSILNFIWSVESEEVGCASYGSCHS